MKVRLTPSNLLCCRFFSVFHTLKNTIYNFIIVPFCETINRGFSISYFGDFIVTTRPKGDGEQNRNGNGMVGKQLQS